MSMVLARISHTRCCLRRFKKPTGQKPRAVRSGGSDKRGDAPCWLLQPALRVAFRRASPASGGSTVCPDTLFAAPMPYLPRRKSNAGDMECEKCGLAGPVHVPDSGDAFSCSRATATEMPSLPASLLLVGSNEVHEQRLRVPVRVDPRTHQWRDRPDRPTR